MIAVKQAHQFARSSRDPSPQEIARQCAEIRRGWNAAERRERAALASLYRACLLDVSNQSAA